MNSNSFKLIDDQDREFTSSSEDETELIYGKQDLIMKSVNPDLSVSGMIVFDVPKDAKGFKLKATGGMT